MMGMSKKMYIAALAGVLCLGIINPAYGGEPGTGGSWRQENSQWYYYDEKGSMLTGWILVDGKYYYLYEDGHCAINEITPDGYRVDESGVWYEVKKDILGQTFAVPAGFVTPASMGEGWGKNGQALTELGRTVSASVGQNRKLAISEYDMEYLSLDGEIRYMGLYKDPGIQGYRLDLGLRLDRTNGEGNKAAECDYGVFRAFLSSISSTPDELAEAIYSGWQGQNIYGISRSTPVAVGDCSVTYEAGQGYGRFFIQP